MTTTTAARTVPLVKAPRYAATPIWDALHAEHGPALAAATRASLTAAAATAAALADLPAVDRPDPADGGGEPHPAETAP